MTMLCVAAVLLFAADKPPAPVDAFGDPLPPGAIARMGTVRLRHGARVDTIAYSPDGKLLASGSVNGELRLWDATTGKLVRAFVSPTGGAVTYAIAFSPDGELLASDCAGTIRLWQVSTGKILRDLDGRRDVHSASVAFSPDGKELAVANELDTAIQIFDPSTGKLRRKITGHESPAVVAVYSKDGKFLASGSKDKTARIWDAASGKELHRFQESEELVDVALSPDGKLLATETLRAVRLWDVVSGKEVHRFNDGGRGLRSLAFSPDGKVLGWAGVLWDAATGKEVCRCEGALIGDMAFSPDGKTIAAGGDDNGVYLLDSATGKELPKSAARWNHGTQNVVGFTRDGKGLVLRGEDDGGLHLCETATGKEIREYATDKESPQVAVLAPDGKTLAAATDFGAINVWETATGKRLYRLKGPEERINGGRAWALAFAPDSRTLAAAAGENVIRLWDPATGKELRQFRGHEGEVDSLFFLPDGKTLVSTSRDNTTRFWDIVNGKEQSARLKQTGSIRAVSPDGRTAAVYQSLTDRALRLREVATGREVHRLTAVYYPGFCAFSPDGKTLAVYADRSYTPEHERPILLLEAATGKVRATLTGHTGGVYGEMAFSPDGRMLASGSSDTTALVWDATGRMRNGRFETTVLSPKELHDSWTALASDDAAEAYRATWALTSSPEQILPLLKEHLRPLLAADPKETARRLADLDSDDFNVREKADKELAGQGDLVEAGLCKTLDERPSPEVRRRVEHLLEKLAAPRQLQEYRAIEVLERIGTSEAEKVLKEVAAGAPAARMTREAKVSLERLSRKPAP
jgi:WD40 repeat protein